MFYFSGSGFPIPENGTLIQVEVLQEMQRETGDLIERPMGKMPELRFKCIQENGQFAAADVDVRRSVPGDR